jgi:hypothetical protein
LFAIIKQRISSSSHAIFDATGGNANVSLEYGYAEGIEVPRSIYVSAHKASSKTSAGGAIISDLSGKRRVQYTTETTLSKELHKLCRDHPYTARFEKSLKGCQQRFGKGQEKKSAVARDQNHQSFGWQRQDAPRGPRSGPSGERLQRIGSRVDTQRIAFGRHLEVYRRKIL